jgi:hypothetical protein
MDSILDQYLSERFNFGFVSGCQKLHPVSSEAVMNYELQCAVRA